MTVEREIGERLNSWKEIANYLGRDVRTAIRWEKSKGLPIRRVPGGQRQAVFAYKHEIDSWFNQTQESLSDPPSNTSSAPAEFVAPVPNAKLLRLLALGAFFLLAAVLLGYAVIRSSSMSTGARIKKLTSDATYKIGAVTDGTQVFFSERVDGRLLLSSVSRDGGPVRHIPTGLADAYPIDISKDGTELLVLVLDGIETERPLWIVPVTGTPRVVGGIRCHDAAWSPDGTKAIAYATGENLFLTLDEGRSSRKLGTFGPYPDQLRWDVSGRHLRFLHYDHRDVKGPPWSLTVEGNFNPGMAQPIADAAGCCANWSSVLQTGQFLWTDRDSAKVWKSPEPNGWMGWRPDTISLDLLQPPLTIARGVSDSRFFVMSPGQYTFELLRFNLASGQFAPYPRNLQGSYLDFSPDGRKICFVRTADRSLWVSQADGTQERQLTFGQDVELPRWSPDGGRIAFTARSATKTWRVFVVPASGGVPEEVLSVGENQGAPTWSPDGKFLMFANIECYKNDRCAVHQAFFSDKTDHELPNSKGLRTARLSPNGRFVAALHPESHKLLLFDFKTQHWRQLAVDANEDDISWSPDSRLIYYARSTAAGRSIARLALDKGKADTAVDLSAFSDLGAGFTSWFCLAPDGSIIVLRQVESYELYAVDWTHR